MVLTIRRHPRWGPLSKENRANILVWANDMQELKSRISTISNNCKRLNIVLSKKKFQVGSQLPFAGYIVGEKGVQLDLEKVSAIKQFATPKNVTDVKSTVVKK